MRKLLFCLAGMLLAITASMSAQNPPAKTVPAPAPSSPAGHEAASFPEAPAALQAILQDKIKAEWEAVKKRDKTAFSNLLAEDFVQVEADGDGARNRFKAANELAESFLQDSHLQLFKFYALAPGVTYARYENTMEFPVRSALRYKRMWISELWVKQGNDWKLWRYQETPVK